ncbi:MAG: zinc dependent phospholipase C family protein [Clostridia bacterium]|nr:zinc dependent phospholipase C family protein [Clostridia bacterium]
MPSCITHQLIAEDAAKRLPPELNACATAHPDYYFLGAQGPDVFFFFRPLSQKQMNLGRYLHRYRVYDVFTAFAQAPNRFSSFHRTRMTAYVAGYLCHYCADVAFHPFVYAYLEKHACDKTQHQLMETDWDVYFAHTRRGKDAVGWKFPFTAKTVNNDGTLFLLYTYLCSALSLPHPNKGKFERGISYFERYLKFFHKHSHHQGWARTERLLHLSPVVSALYPRKNPNPEWLFGKELSALCGVDSVSELYDKAVDEIARLAPSLFSPPLPRTDFDKSFLTAEPTE